MALMKTLLMIRSKNIQDRTTLIKLVAQSACHCAIIFKSKILLKYWIAVNLIFLHWYFILKNCWKCSSLMVPMLENAALNVMENWFTRKGVCSVHPANGRNVGKIEVKVKVEVEI